MRKRNIHTIAHWCMMFLLLMFPLLMVGISTFGNDHTDVNINYNYNSNIVDDVNNDLIVDNIYNFDGYIDNNDDLPSDNYFSFYILNGDITFDNANIEDDYLDVLELYSTIDYTITFGQGLTLYYNSSYVVELTCDSITFDNAILQLIDIHFVNHLSFNNLDVSYTDYNTIRSVDTVTLSYKDDVNKWCNGFIDLNVNAWYKSLLTVVGIGLTNSSVMNIIYIMPLYIIWVYIFDVVVDCLLVIIKLPHKLLNRLSGGEND